MGAPPAPPGPPAPPAHPSACAAFIRAAMAAPRSAAPLATCTRRSALKAFVFAAGAHAAAALLPTPAARGADERPGLPSGAAQLSQVVAAQRQWSSLAGVVDAGGRELADTEWESLRGYLRNVYSVSGDMEYLTKGWDKEARKRGQEVIKRFRRTVKGMDKPAAAKDLKEFSRLHAEVVGCFEEFFAAQKAGVVSDVPDEL